MSNFSLIYITNRQNCCAQWMADGLCRQVGNTEFPQVIIVDSCVWNDPVARKKMWDDAIRGRFEYTLTAPKPCVWQGPHRLTKADYFAASNARNTGACFARHPYLIWMDDLSIILPGWLSNARHAAKHKYVVGGTYRKVRKLVVQEGEVVSFEPDMNSEGKDMGQDCRSGRNKGRGIEPMTPGELYGCSFGVPLDAYLRINGQDEIYDGCGFEDTASGYCLSNNGYQDRIFFNGNMATWESAELHAQGPTMLREDRGKSPHDMSHALSYASCVGPSGNGGHGAFNNKGYIRAVGNHFDLAKLRAMILNGGQFPIPTEPSKLWWDNTPLKEMPQ